MGDSHRQPLFVDPLPTLRTLAVPPVAGSLGTWARWRPQEISVPRHPLLKMSNIKFYITIAVVAYVGSRIIDMVLAKVLPAKKP